MPFNAETYRLNQYRKGRDARMAEARKLKARVEAGIAFDWEASRIPRMVELARIENRLVISQRRVIACTKAQREIAATPAHAFGRR